jgi:hypothetical protein
MLNYGIRRNKIFILTFLTALNRTGSFIIYTERKKQKRIWRFRIGKKN